MLENGCLLKRPSLQKKLEHVVAKHHPIHSKKGAQIKQVHKILKINAAPSNSPFTLAYSCINVQNKTGHSV